MELQHSKAIAYNDLMKMLENQQATMERLEADIKKATLANPYAAGN